MNKQFLSYAKKNHENKCIYNSLWVISGQEIPDLPSNNGDDFAPYYVEQFVDCAIQFWKNEGSLVLMAENDPYTFQLNLFLKKLVFPDGKKLNFTIGGNHKGGEILDADYTGKLYKERTFNKEKQKVKNVESHSLGYNLYHIFEGVTVAYTMGGSIEPFIPFSRDSDGGINSLFYNGLDRGDGTGEGNIFIDCGYTKFFLDMKKCGTSRYLQNIGGFIGSAERRANASCEPKYYRPNGVNFMLNKDPKLYYNYPKRPFDVIYLVDATGSMGGSIENVKNYCVDISNILNNQKNQKIIYHFRFGAVFYRDPIDIYEIPDKNELYDLTDDIVSLQQYVQSIEAYGGGDIPEDWVGAYKKCLYELSWRKEAIKLIIYITDAGAHGTEYSDGDKYEGEGPKLDELIKECSDKKINIIAFQIGDSPKKSFSRVAELYKKYGNEKKFKIQLFNQDKKDRDYFTNLVVDNITKVT